MTTTPYAAGARTVVIHEDDVGMSHGANAAFQELSRMGACSAGSVMAPCPWFPEAVAMARADPTLDLGVHLTLNSEKQPYRWRPLTSLRRARRASPTKPATSGRPSPRFASTPPPRLSKRSCGPRSTRRSTRAST